MSRFAELEAFVRVVERESFSDAARELGVSKSYVSKYVSRLEDRLGARLLNRTTRTLVLTDVGEAFYARAQDILANLEEAELAVSELQTTARGTLRVSVPLSFGVKYVAPALTRFMKQYPELKVDVTFTDRRVDVVDEGFDLAVRIGDLADSSLVARRITPLDRVAVASPEYFAERGRPTHPEELRAHACLIYTLQTSGPTWRFVGESGEEAAVKVDGPLRADNGDALRDAALTGLGIALLPTFFVHEDIEAGLLETALDEWCSWRAAIWALYPHNRHLSAKVRLCVDFLVEEFGGQAPWSKERARASGFEIA